MLAGWPARPTRPPLPLALAHTGELSTAPPLEMGRSVTPLCSLLLHLQDPRGSNHISGQPYTQHHKPLTLNLTPPHRILISGHQRLLAYDPASPATGAAGAHALCLSRGFSGAGVVRGFALGPAQARAVAAKGGWGTYNLASKSPCE